MKLDRAISEVGEAEATLRSKLLSLTDRHVSESDVFYTGHTLARACADQLVALQPVASRYSASLPAPESGDTSRAMKAVEHTVSSILGRHESAGLRLVDDLRSAYLAAQAAELDWTVLLQAAKAARDRDLIDVASTGQEHAERCGKWLRSRIKQSSAQVFASS